MTTPTTVQVRLQIRADTAANWTSVNPVLLANELGLESDTKKFKIGNGSSTWGSLAYFPSIVSGGTVLGNLEIGTTGTLTFEGSTADGFETTLGVVDPTADRTILLPNQSGTVVVGGNASITNADIAANAEIAVSKLADGAARQVLQTDAAGTGVEWTDNVDIPGTLDVTGAATFDAAVTVAGDLTVNGTTTTISTQNLLVEDKNIIIGDVATPTDTTADGGGITLKGATDKTINWVDSTDAWTSSERFSVPLGSASAPSLTFTGDENTGIYSPGADQVAISTNGTGRVFIDSSGRVGIGTASPSQLLNVSSSGTATVSCATSDTSGPSIGRFRAVYAGGGGGTTSFVDLRAGDGYGYLLAESNVPLLLGTNNTERARIDSSGRVGIGTASPSELLHVSGPGTTTVRVASTDTSGSAVSRFRAVFLNGGTGGANNALDLRAGNQYCYLLTEADVPFLFGTNNTERLRIDNSGRLLVGTSSSRTGGLLQVESVSSTIERIHQFTNNSASAAGPILVFYKTRGTAVGSNTLVSNNDDLGAIVFSGADGTNRIDGALIQAFVDGTPGANDMPGRLVFSVTRDGQASPTSAMRITNSGRTVVLGNTNAFDAYSEQGAGTSFELFIGGHSATTTAPGSGTNSFRVFTNGNVQNTNNSYGSLSDAKLKENIVDAGSQWNDLKSLQVRKYNFKEETGQQTHTQIGLVAQEVELVSPGLVTESPDRDAEGNDLGTVTKSVNYSVLYMKAVKALQEAMERIETLEAKVAALESA